MTFIFDDEDQDALDAWDFAVDFDVSADGEIAIAPVARFASDENAGYAL